MTDKDREVLSILYQSAIQLGIDAPVIRKEWEEDLAKRQEAIETAAAKKAKSESETTEGLGHGTRSGSHPKGGA